ncbi:hypothetical protein FB192DRAFT_1370105 [Mucor lusitanicus]|uniref:Uncharacterized protein n=2 Tax=Mucor circinelloides f. lusitanicus TaxID=29924 RepID=A0A168PWD2_MUCCL|nr:hypothetical protein FB192DRAFT_1370105 [Mucor lusitanicus]OAD08331.1 hypothetical protein MUCCIDRAFT_76758 [Mucor lusitanicus CBS 277.49]
MNVLSAFTDQKKIRPVYQFKRGNTFTSLRHPGVNAFKPAAFQSTNMLPKTDSMLLQTVSPSSSTSSTAEGHATPDSSNSTPSVPDNEDEDDAIFDFPSALDEFVEIKVMVASNSRTVPEAPKLARKRSKPKQNATPPVSPAKKKPPTTAGTTPSKPKSPINPHTKKRPVSTGPTAVLPCADQDEFDIFAFDPQPTSHLTHKRKPGPKSKPTMITSTSPSSSSSSRFNPTHYTANTYIPPMPAYHTNPVHLPLLHPSISIASLLNEPSPLQPHQAQPVEKKRKRNLVARLKTASGEKENKHLQEFDCLSDEDDLALEQQKSPPLLPLKTVIKDPSLSPEISYEETMQMQLDSLMKTEFGESQQPPAASTNTRPQYQPSNKLNVRVTFQKKQR